MPRLFHDVNFNPFILIQLVTARITLKWNLIGILLCWHFGIKTLDNWCYLTTWKIQEENHDWVMILLIWIVMMPHSTDGLASLKSAAIEVQFCGTQTHSETNFCISWLVTLGLQTSECADLTALDLIWLTAKYIFTVQLLTVR